jgi:hypothetical protein
MIGTRHSTQHCILDSHPLGNSREQFMDIATHRARITGPVSYLSSSGRKQNIPIGPCLVERVGSRSIDIIWGACGQSSVAFSIEEIEAAQDRGYLVLLD